MGQLKGRKFRNLDNGKMYVTKNYAASASKRSESAKARMRRDPDQLKKARETALLPKNLSKRNAAIKRFYANNPGFSHENRLKMYEDNPHLRKVRSDHMTIYRGYVGFFTTDADNMENLIEQYRTYKNGKQVIRYVDCEREKTTGVTNY